MILAIDAGNSRTKWGVFDAAGELQAQGVCLNADLASMEMPRAWKSCERAVISNVAGTAVAEALKTILVMPVNWVRAAEYACGVNNSYTKPQQLGVDRWAALIAAWHRYHKPCVVVNAGTALTIDALGMDGQHGVFIGGLIAPGLRLMQQSLKQGTAGVAELSGSFKDFPTSTGDAFYTGALIAMTGAIKSMFTRLQQHENQAPRCILSGGDASLLAEMLSADPEVAKHLVIADNLVLQGLLLMEKGAVE